MNQRARKWFGHRGVQLAATGVVSFCVVSVLQGGEPIILPNGTAGLPASSPVFQPGDPIQFSEINAKTTLPTESRYDEQRLSTAESATRQAMFEGPNSPTSPRAAGPRTVRRGPVRQNDKKELWSEEANDKEAIDKGFGIKSEGIEKKGSFLGNVETPTASNQAQNRNSKAEGLDAEEESPKASGQGSEGNLGAHQNKDLDLTRALNLSPTIGGSDFSLHEIFPGSSATRLRDTPARREEANRFLNSTKATETPAGGADLVSPIPGLGQSPGNSISPKAPDSGINSSPAGPFAPRLDPGRPASSPAAPSSPNSYSPNIGGFSSLPPSYAPRRSLMDSAPIEMPRRKF